MPRKPVAMSQLTSALILPCCAERTPSAMVRELAISTTVLKPPSSIDSSWLPAANAVGSFQR